MRLASALFASLFLANYAHAFGVTEGQFNGRDYLTDYRQEGQRRDLPEGSVKISKRGTMIIADDFKNGIVYQIDPSNPGEQEINPSIITKLRAAPGSRAVARIIEKMSISDVKDIPGNRMTANVNIYLNNSTAFGNLKAKLVLGVNLISATCPIKVITYHPGVYTSDPSKNVQAFETTSYTQVNCISYEIGTNVEVKDLSSGLPKQFNAAIGLAADTVLKVLSPTFAHQASLYQVK